MTTTNDDILHIMAGSEPEYVKELRKDLQATRQQLYELKTALEKWNPIVETARVYLLQKRIEESAVDQFKSGVYSYSYDMRIESLRNMLPSLPYISS